jgi:transposase
MKKYSSKNKKSRVRITNAMTMINPDTAGIDIGSEFHFVSVGDDRAEKNVRKYGAYTRDLKGLVVWLKSSRITSVAMESTGVYWIPLYQMLEEAGFEVVLVNARHIKSVAGRPKTDVNDCQWIRRLHSYGLLQASFRPVNEICEIRSLKRHRDELTMGMSRHVQHMQKTLQQSNIRLDKAVSDITGKTGMAIIEAILKGEKNPSELAKLRDRRVKAPESEVAMALEGDYRAEHLFVLKQAYNSYQFTAEQIIDIDKEIQKRLEDLNRKVDPNLKPLPPSTAGSKRSNSNQPAFEIRPYLYKAFGVDLTQVEGFQSNIVLTLLSEVGPDLSSWTVDKKFTSWLGLCVNKEVSSNRVLKNRTRRVSNRASIAFRMAAVSLKNSNCYLGVFYRRIRARAGAPKAITATARKLAVIFYNMVKYQQEYKATDVAAYDMNYKNRALKNLKAKAKFFGYELVEKTVSG